MIDKSQVQAIILNPRPAATMDIAFIRCPHPARLRDLLGVAARTVTYAEGVDHAEPALHVGITGAGFRLLGPDRRTEAAMPQAFLDGMRAASHRLGDRGASRSDRWADQFQSGAPDFHAVIIACGAHRASTSIGDGPSPVTWGDLTEFVGATTPIWHGQAIEGPPGPVGPDGQPERRFYEPFGFRDGLSDPVIEGSGRKVTPGNGVWDSALGGWRAVKAGEAILGHVDERGLVSGHVDAAAIERDGSYLAIRRIQQFVAAFETACGRIAAEVQADDPTIDAEAVGSQLVGRHKDGRYLGQLPGQDRNGFLYRDPTWRAEQVSPTCHIRRANPRDDVEEADTMVKRHLLFRRGIPYEDGAERGLLFLAVCADLARQFEFVQAQWLQDGNRFGLGPQPDGLTGDRVPGRLTPARTISLRGSQGQRINVEELTVPDSNANPAADDGETETEGIASFVQIRGGEYVLLPGRAALERMSIDGGPL